MTAHKSYRDSMNGSLERAIALWCKSGSFHNIRWTNPLPGASYVTATSLMRARGAPANVPPNHSKKAKSISVKAPETVQLWRCFSAGCPNTPVRLRRHLDLKLG